MAVVTMKQLLSAGVHFGHQTRRWNPKMRRFILGERNGIYLVDLQQTMKGSRRRTPIPGTWSPGAEASSSWAPRSRPKDRSPRTPRRVGCPT